MASVEAVASGLAVLHEAHPTREVTKQTAQVWHRLFLDTDDAAFVRACEALACEAGRQFFPTPGELIAKLRGPRPAIDVDGIVKRIESLGYHNPHAGWVWPRAERVRDVLGGGIAEAYGAVGQRLGADEGTGRDIALRDFAEHLSAVVDREGPAALSAPTVRALPPGEHPGNAAVRQLAEKFTHPTTVSPK